MCKARSFCLSSSTCSVSKSPYIHYPEQNVLQGLQCAENGEFWTCPAFLCLALKSRIAVLCIPCVFIPLFPVHSWPRTGIYRERCPTCSAILLLSHKTDESKRRDEGQESSLYLTHLCSASGEFCGITSAGKVCKQSNCLHGLKGVSQISNILGTWKKKCYQAVGATRV